MKKRFDKKIYLKLTLQMKVFAIKMKCDSFGGLLGKKQD